MSHAIFYASPFVETDVLRALECGVHGILAERAMEQTVRTWARVDFVPLEDVHVFEIKGQAEEQKLIERVCAGKASIVRLPWAVIPLENILATLHTLCAAGLPMPFFGVECHNAEQARLASAILECGVPNLLVFSESLAKLAEIVQICRCERPVLDLQAARITRIMPVGLGHRVCVDTLSILEQGQGMLVGNSAAFSFLVHAETEYNEYVAARPFRVNAGAVHEYAWLPDDRTCYLEELRAGDEILLCNAQGQGRSAIVGRVKKEQRPMLLVEACVEQQGQSMCGTLFLQNAETVHLVGEDAKPVSVVKLAVGDNVLVHLESAGRHFGMRISEDIREV